MFVGAERRALVNQLVGSLDRVQGSGEPELIVLIASPGWGKTRVVQEFYRDLAAGQPSPAYWPSRLVDEVTDGQLGLSELTIARKAVRHRGPLDPPAGAVMPWLWLAPASGRLSDGSAAPAFDGLIDQLVPHLPELQRRAAAHDMLDHDRREALNMAVAAMMAGTDKRSERPAQLAGLLTDLLARDRDDGFLPAVVVLDDAHDLDASTIGFVSDVLASQLPILVIAATWPEKVMSVRNRTQASFSAYLAEAGASDRVTQVWLAELSADDLIGYIVGQFPATDQQVAVALAERAGHNPYALRLLLNTPRVAGSVRNAGITMDPREIGDLNGQLETLLAEHWNELPAGVRQVLVAAALIGQSFIDEILEAGLRRLHPAAGLNDALASSWIRPLGGSGRVLEFTERLRYEIAQGDVPNFLSLRERADIYSGALRALRQLLPAEPDGTGRVILLALHVLLAKEGIEKDLAAAAASAAELAERARSEIRRLDGIEYYQLAIGWAERGQPLPYGQLVQYLIGYSTMTRIHYGRPEGEASAVRALELADEHLDRRDELRIHARCAIARARRRRDDLAAYQSAQQLLGEAQDLLSQADAPSAEARQDVWSCEVGDSQARGDYQRAAALARDLAGFCEREFGPLHRHTLEALTDLGYNLHRSGGATEAIPVRRTLLERRVRRFNDAGHLQTAGAKNDLAASLLATRDPLNLAEAERLTEESVTSRSRAFGYDGRSTQNSRSLRARIWLAKGLFSEGSGHDEMAAECFERAGAETASILSLRQGQDPARRATSQQRHGEALACLRHNDALQAIDDALEIRERELGQDHAFWPVIDCAKSLWWAYQRLGRPAEAQAVARRYQFTGDSHRWIPAFVPEGSVISAQNPNPVAAQQHRTRREHGRVPTGDSVMAGHAFLCYVHEDSPAVDRLHEALEAAGVPVWRDTARLWPGQDWQAEIRRAITADALVFLACFSRRSLSRETSYHFEELGLAIEQMRIRRPGASWLIPVRLDDCDVPDLDVGGGRTLAFIQRADLFGARYEQNLATLIAAVEAVLGHSAPR